MKRFLPLAFAILALCLAACEREPSWIAEGSHERERAFFGVGKASGIRNPSLRRTMADAKARGQIATRLDEFERALDKAVLAGMTTGSRAADKGPPVEVFRDTQVERHLTSVQIVEHWTSRKGDEYARAKLELSSVLEQLAKAPEPHATAAQAQAAFDELAKR